MQFNQADWAEVIKRPDWPVEFVRFANQVKANYQADPKQIDQLNKQVRTFFENALQANQVKLAQSGPDQDAERQPIDTIVIHHTSNQPGYRLSYLNAVHLLNIYAPVFAHDKKPVWSGHFHDGKQIFW